MMTREELAARIFCTYLANPNQGHFDYSECFRKADAFLAYASKQRKPKDVESTAGKPNERKAVELWLNFNAEGRPSMTWDGPLYENKRILFREVLPEDKK